MTRCTKRKLTAKCRRALRNFTGKRILNSTEPTNRGLISNYSSARLLDQDKFLKNCIQSSKRLLSYSPSQIQFSSFSKSLFEGLINCYWKKRNRQDGFHLSSWNTWNVFRVNFIQFKQRANVLRWSFLCSWNPVSILKEIRKYAHNLHD